MKRPRVFPGAVSFFVIRRDSISPQGLLKSNPQKTDKSGALRLAKRNPFAAIAHGHDLAEAIVDAIREPLLVLDPDLRVIAASRSFYRTFAVTPRKTEGQLVFDLGDGQWNIPKLRALLEDIIPKRRTVESYEVEHEFPSIGRRVMLLNGRRVFDENGAATAILLAIEDVTRRREADREKDELLQAKEILLQEMQHRVANSLQIIASILLLKARTVQSEETRLHLQDAHQRVMSVATVQQQLHASGLNERIEIGPYLTKLCASLAASMIGERRPLSIKVQASSGGATSSEAVSLGLIVTELVINALKHGFPSRRGGRNPGQLRRARLRLASFGCRQWIRDPRKRTASLTHWPWHEHRRGIGASAQGNGREVERTGGHHGLNYCPRSQLEAELHMVVCPLWVKSGPLT